MSLSSQTDESVGTRSSPEDSSSPAVDPILERPSEPQPVPQSSFSGAERPQSATIGRFPEWIPSPSQSRDPGSEARRLSLIAADRKRRLTDSPHGPLRRRTNSGGFLTEDGNMNLPSSSRTMEVSGASAGPARTRPSFPNFSHNHPGERPQFSPRSSGHESGQYALPRWQPDSEVSRCPICGSQFTWYFRKHHCRKCGRVVCANCSPHRITIPRQFIVYPPLPNQGPEGASTPATTNVVDLTGDDDDRSGEVDASRTRRPSSSQYSNPALGGGEEVRLCNPCVPDPQPEPAPAFASPSFSASTWTARNSHWLGGSGMPTGWEAFQRQRAFSGANHPVYRFTEQARQELRRQRGRGMIFTPESQTGEATRTRPLEIPDESLPDYGRFGVTVMPDLQRRGNPPIYRDHASILRPPDYTPSSASLPAGTALRNSMPVTGFHTSGPGRGTAQEGSRHPPQVPDFSSNRPRVRSMLDVAVPPPPSFEIARHHRPRIHERDLCPICRHILPPLGDDGDESAREQHVMDCISARDPTYIAESPSRHSAPADSLRPLVPGASPPPLLPNHVPLPVYMLRFNATEKDCTGQDGTQQECSICMVEYEVGEKLIRLECLCKFHEECIASWFRRKRECPVHKRDEREAI